MNEWMNILHTHTHAYDSNQKGEKKQFIIWLSLVVVVVVVDDIFCHQLNNNNNNKMMFFFLLEMLKY